MNKHLLEVLISHETLRTTSYEELDNIEDSVNRVLNAALASTNQFIAEDVMADYKNIIVAIDHIRTTLIDSGIMINNIIDEAESEQE